MFRLNTLLILTLMCMWCIINAYSKEVKFLDNLPEVRLRGHKWLNSGDTIELKVDFNDQDHFPNEWISVNRSNQHVESASGTYLVMRHDNKGTYTIMTYYKRPRVLLCACGKKFGDRTIYDVWTSTVFFQVRLLTDQGHFNCIGMSSHTVDDRLIMARADVQVI